MLRRRPVPLLLLLLLALGSTRCASLGYYGQAVRGQLQVLRKKEPIPRLLADPAVDAGLKERLGTILAMRRLAVEELGLPDDGSYGSYADLQRPYAVWTVVAAPELSLEPRQWCFPIAGCVTYRGYFSRQGAERYAARLAREGWEVEVSGRIAYSTLGWLRDPLLNTFVELPEAELAGLLFHELAHQVVYVRDDTTFNESFATVVELAGVRRWLAARGRPEEMAAYRRAKRREEEVLELLLAWRERLAAVYAAEETAAWKRTRKAKLFADLRTAYRERVQAWGGDDRFQGWFDDGLNNARLASLGAYYELVPAFQALLAREGGDLPRFYARVRELAHLPPEARRERLVPASKDAE